MALVRRSGRFAGAASFGDWDVEEGRVLWSPPLEEILGEPSPGSRVPVDWWRDRIHPEDRGRAAQAADAAIAGDGTRYECSYRIRRADGAWLKVRERGFIVRRDGRAVRVVAAILDADAAVVNDDAPSLFTWLEQDAERFRTFVDGLPLLAWAMTPEGWIYFYNQRWYDYTGTTPEQMEGWGWVAAHDPDDLPRMLRVFRRALASGEMWEDEFRLRRADGEMRWHISRAMPLRDREGRVIHWLGTNTEIHDQKLALEERTRLLAREQEARRLAEAANRAKDDFLAMVSHELRSPLNAIVGWVDVMEQGPSADVREQAIAALKRSVQQQATLIEDLLDTSRMLSGKLKIHYLPTRLAEPVRAAVETVLPRLEEQGIAVRVTDHSEGAVVVGDPARLEQIVLNLLGNAAKFSTRGQTIEVRILQADTRVVIEVEDQGDGIEPQFLPRIFDRFAQADSSSTRRHGGLGLGLSIVRHLVELHGGTIGVTSRGRGLGACFRIELPPGQSAAPVLARDASASRPSDVAISLRGIRVLVVDDDPEAREVLSALLLSRGGSVATAGSVAEALEALRSDVPDVILSDIAMPEIDGFGLVSRVRALRDPRVTKLPIVALTAFASVSDRDEAIAAGFDAHLSKPVDTGRLVRTLVGVAQPQIAADEPSRS